MRVHHLALQDDVPDQQVDGRPGVLASLALDICDIPGKGRPPLPGQQQSSSHHFVTQSGLEAPEEGDNSQKDLVLFSGGSGRRE